MNEKSRITIKVEIDAPRNIVGKYADDLSLITSFHPKVKKVDFLSGKRFREKGVKYQCIIPKGNKEWSCIEEVTEYEKDTKMVTVTSGGNMNIEKFLGSFTSELLFSDLDNGGTLLTLNNYYEPKGLIGHIINSFFKLEVEKAISKNLYWVKRTY